MYRKKAMAPHSSTLAWKFPWTEEPGGLPSMESHGVGLKQLSSSSSSSMYRVQLKLVHPGMKAL